MKTVFIVEGGCFPDDSGIVAVFASEESAKRFVAEKNRPAEEYHQETFARAGYAPGEDIDWRVDADKSRRWQQMVAHNPHPTFVYLDYEVQD